MNLFSFDQVSLEFGDQPLLSHASFVMEAGERVCLIGRNGAGKSSLLRLISGELSPDHGRIQFARDLVVSRLEQTLPGEQTLTVRAIVAQGLSDLQTRLDAYQRQSAAAATPAELRALARLENQIEAQGGWNPEARVDALITEMGLPGDVPLSTLSGGWRRRVSLARALVRHPDLLLLDEPTNHLDLASIRWLEDRVRSFPGSVLFITHDRAFLGRLATRIVEIDRGQVTSWPGNYQDYLRRKEAALEAESEQQREFDRKLAREESWIRQGMKARRKRNEGRVRALQAMRDERAGRRAPQAGPSIDVAEAERSGRKVIEARNLRHGFADAPLIDGLSLKIMRGDRIGLIGNNGIGKTTLLRILLGELTPQAGSVKLGTGLEIGYFDQLRRTLDPAKSVAEVVGDGHDHVTVNGRQRHIIGYLKGFLFSPARARSPVKSLSGGETNRLILARLFTRPSNLLVLDEPTNDLDVETLEVLEARLAEFPGTLIVVSHDRQFLDNVVTSVLVFEPGGQIREYLGGYSDWERRQRALDERGPAAGQNRPVRQAVPPAARPGSASGKLSYKYKLELERLPDRIEALEQEVAALQEQAGDPALYDRPYAEYSGLLERLKDHQQELARAIERWSELESLQEAQRDR